MPESYTGTLYTYFPNDNISLLQGNALETVNTYNFTFSEISSHSYKTKRISG